MSILNKRYFTSEKMAFKHLENILWPGGPVCPKCGSCTQPYDLAKTRVGLKKCRDCKKQFTVRIGTVYESSHIPLHKWLQATYLICSSKKGISAHQLHRILGITYKSAWFMCHRIREAMKDGGLPLMGGEGESVQVDETYFGKKEIVTKRTKRGKPSHSSKMSVVTLIGGGKSRTFHVDTANIQTVQEILVKNVRRETELHTDESRLYIKVGAQFAKHETVKHTAGEYVRGHVHVNKCENYFSIFKRGMRGIYQHCNERHLQRYLAEFDHRYNTRKMDDFERTELALKGAVGKRLMYKTQAC
jgi:transposase-like protein